MKNLLFIFILLSCSVCFSQSDDKEEPVLLIKDTLPLKPVKIDPLAPSKAAFYSAILPGMGQAYNKKYWKIPIVYGALGTSIYIASWNNKKYHEYRDAYKDRLAGREVTGELAALEQDRLIAAQRAYQRNRDLWVLITAGVYILNIVEANVDAHLMQFNVDENLTLKPDLQQNQIDYKYNMGLTLSYQF